jgi:hypothetical protein
MPSGCSGPSRPKAGQPDWFFFDPIALPPPFNTIAAWLTSAALNLPNTPVRTVDFCSSYPEGDLPTTEDWVKLAFPPLALATGTYSRLGNFVRQQVFSDRCECSPTGTGSCVHREGVLTFGVANPTVSICGSNTWYCDQSSGLFAFPSGQHYVRVRMPDIVTTHDLQFDVYSPSIGERCFTWLAGTSFDIYFAGNLTDTSWELAFRDAGSRPIWLEGQRMLFDYVNLPAEPACNPTTGTPVTVPHPEPPPANYPPPPTSSCGTFADICAALQVLTLKVQAIASGVTILQRWGLPFGYIEGSEHPNLTGTGSLQISRLLGMHVYVVSPPPGEPVLPGNPPYLWDVGWMSVSDSNGMLVEKRITRSGFDWMPEEMPLASSFNYQLNAGVVLTLREIRPEP